MNTRFIRTRGTNAFRCINPFNIRHFSSTILLVLILNHHTHQNSLVVHADDAPPENPPTPSPTPSPTFAPTPSPTPLPTLSPTPSPTLSPTPSPTSSPSNKPSSKPSATVPTTSPPAPSPLLSFTHKDITITLTGVMPLNDEEKAYFESRTESYVQYYYDPPPDPDLDSDATGLGTRKLESNMFPTTSGENLMSKQMEMEIAMLEKSMNDDLKRKLQNVDSVYDVSVSITVTGMDPPYMNPRFLKGQGQHAGAKSVAEEVESRRSVRKLQSNSLRITYDQSMEYRYNGVAGTDAPTDEVLVTEPFSLLTKRKEYINFLKNLPDIQPVAKAFENLSKVSPAVLADKSKPVSMVAIISAVAGGVVSLILVFLGFRWWKKKGEKGDGLDDYDPRSRPEASRPQPSDGGSTLVEPQQEGVYTQPTARYPGSIATDDPDYLFNTAGYEDQTLVSNTDGTLGDATRQSSQIQAGESVLGPMEAQSIFSDDQSFEAFRNQRDGRTEEVLEIIAPAGRLGVVIDTPDTGAPILHRIKDTCPIADKLQVGDHLVAVDGENVRSMTAVEVSKLISLKSGNKERRFTIVRYAR